VSFWTSPSLVAVRVLRRNPPASTDTSCALPRICLQQASYQLQLEPYLTDVPFETDRIIITAVISLVGLYVLFASFSFSFLFSFLVLTFRLFVPVVWWGSLYISIVMFRLSISRLRSITPSYTKVLLPRAFLQA
jgi:hypothetical protein